MKKLILLIIALPVLYLVSYFLLMEEGTALNPDTKLPEYRSVSKFAKGVRIDGPVNIHITESHWMNPVYEPLDRIFRK